MNSEQARLKYLFEKYFEKTANAEERTELTDLISVEANKDYVMQLLADSWEKHGSGLVTFHGQTGNIMFIGTSSESTQQFFDEINEKFMEPMSDDEMNQLFVVNYIENLKRSAF